MHLIHHKKQLSPNISLFEIDAPLIAKKHQAGNFVILRINEFGERIPLTIVDSNKENGRITLIVQSIGKTTEMMKNLETGDFIKDLVGPLGEATPITNYGTVVCVGGGVGTAVIYPLAKALKDAGNKVISITGAQNAAAVILEDEMHSCSDELILTTDDGSTGKKGFVTHALSELLKSEIKPDYVFTTGPLGMMKAVSELTKSWKIPTMASLNPIMMDGTGMCGACRVTVGNELKFACVDGPEFDAHAIDFDELITRNGNYKKIEKKAVKNGVSKVTCKTGVPA